MWAGESFRGMLGLCVQHMIGDSGRWGGTWNFQGALLVIFAGQETSEFEDVSVYQCGVSCKLATLHAWVVFKIKTGGGEKRDNVLHCDSLHAL